MPIVTMQGGGRFHNTLQDYMGVGELGCTGDHRLVLRNEWTAPFGEYRMIYVNIDSPKIGFPYCYCLGGGIEKAPCKSDWINWT